MGSGQSSRDFAIISAERVNNGDPAPDKSCRQRFYYPELDTIRVFLFIGVWSYHALPKDTSYYLARHVPSVLAWLVAGMIRGGMCSLDVFFVLSAFLVTELLLREKELRTTPDLKLFYIRRLLRIWPLYFFTIALAGLASIWDRSQPLTFGYAAAFLMFAGNWAIIFHGSPGASMLNPLWSVSFEEQFYLLWPLALRKFSQSQAIKAAVGLLCVANVSRLILLLNDAGARTLWINSFVRLDSIAGGILLAIFLHGRPSPRIRRGFRLALFLLAACIWLIVGTCCGLHNARPPLIGGMIGYPLMAVSAILIFVSLFGASHAGITLVRHPVLVYLGKISYGLYAFHILALRCSYRLFTNYHHTFQMTLSLVTSLAITVAMAMVSFRWLESPFLRLKQQKFTYVSSGPTLAPTDNLTPQVACQASEVASKCTSDLPESNRAFAVLLFQKIIGVRFRSTGF